MKNRNTTNEIPKKSGWYWVRLHKTGNWFMREIIVNSLGIVTIYIDNNNKIIDERFLKRYTEFERSIKRYDPPVSK